MITLRDMRESDIEDYVRWFTRDTGWMDFDAPWEEKGGTTEEEERKGWTEYYESVKNLPEDTVRWKYEVDLDGKHIGWVSWYDDLDYVENPEGIRAVGIDLPEESVYNRGAGTEALRQFILYLKEHGSTSVYTQTWSGNTRMLRVAEKLGFTEVYRKKGFREVNGQKYDAVTLKLDL